MARVDNSKDNKSDGKNNNSNNKSYKATKLKNTRTIRTQLYNENNNNNKNSSYNEMLNKDLSLIKTDEYVNSKKQEIQNLMNTIIKNKKYGSNKRAFQNLPRHLRRRTCSHNVKRVPKRIRKRTLKEMAKSEQKVINGNTDSLKHKKSLTNKQYYKIKMSINLLKLLTRSKFMKRSIPAKIGKFNVGSRFQLRSRIKMMEKIMANNKTLKQKNQLEPLLNNKLGHIDLVGKNEVVKDTLRLNKSFKYYKRQQGNSGHKWLPSHIYNIKRCHMIKYHGFKVALKPTLKCYRMIYRNNGLNVRSDKTLIQDTCHLGKILITNKKKGTGLLNLLTSKFDESTLKFSYKGVYVDGIYYGAVNYMKWVEKDSKILLIVDTAVYKKIIEKLLNLFAKEVEEDILQIDDLTFALGTIKLVGATALNSLLKCIRSYCEEDGENNSFKDLLVLGSQVRDYKEIINNNFIIGLNIKDPRLVKYPHLPQYKKNEIPEVNADFISKWQNMTKYDTNKQLEMLLDNDKRYESYKNKLTIKQLHQKLSSSELHKQSESNIPMLVYKDNDMIANSFSIMLPYHWVMPLYYKLNQLTSTQLIGLNQVNQISYDNGEESLSKNCLMDVTTWQYNQYSYFTALGEREHWLRKNKNRRVNYDKLKVNYNGLTFGELGDPFRSDWKFLYELMNKGTTEVKEFLQNYNWNYDSNWMEHFKTRFTLFKTCKNKDLIHLTLSKVELEDGSKGNIKSHARVFKIPKESLENKTKDYVLNSDVLDLIGFISVGCYDLAEGESTGYAFYNLNDDKKEFYEDKFLIKNPGETIFRLVHKVK